jgi:hypothetical protein
MFFAELNIDNNNIYRRSEIAGLSSDGEYALVGYAIECVVDRGRNTKLFSEAFAIQGFSDNEVYPPHLYHPHSQLHVVRCIMVQYMHNWGPEPGLCTGVVGITPPDERPTVLDVPGCPGGPG